MLIYILAGRANSASYACISAVLCTQNTVEKTLNKAKHRILGNILGGLVGVVYLLNINLINFSPILTAIFISLSIMVIIGLLNAFEIKDSIPVCCTCFLAIALTYDYKTNIYIYTIQRVLDTLIGVLVSFLINKYFKIPKKNEEKK